MDWFQEYRARLTAPEVAVGEIRSGQRIFCQGGAANPIPLMDALVARAEELSDVEIVHLHTEGPAPHVDASMEGHLRLNALFVGSNVRQAVNEGRADTVPIHLSQIPDLFRKGILPVDVALVQVSPPDEHGFCSLGVSVDCAKPAADSAKVVIAEVNRRMPRTLGDSFLHVSRFRWIVETDRPLPEVHRTPGNEVISRIGQFVAGLIEDGSTLQMGIGAIPDAVLSYLTDRRHLGIHTEMFSDGVMELVELGVITNELKTLHRGKIVAAFIMGTQELYNFVHNNPMIEMHSIDYTNDPFVISRNERMVAINSAIQVDLTGQVCADSIGYRIYSGFGGQVDFIRGAARSNGGKPIIALPSTAKDGSISRIVAHLDEGAGVVTTRADVHYVVTEYGVAHLHGKNIRQRARALIDIAHPRFREDLERKAYEVRYLPRVFPAVGLHTDPSQG